jgi:hypothetical protein
MALHERNEMNRLVGFYGFVAYTCLLISPVQAAADIGRAVAVQPNVDAIMPGPSTTALRKDGSVFQDETIATGAHGTARLQFIDATSLSVMPSSEVKLDKFVFAGKRSAQTFILNATVGAFRFTTGHSAHEAYEIVTPAAVIGVRGTRFTFQIDAARHLSVHVEQGAVVVCPRNSHNGCVEAHPGQSVSASVGSLPIIVAGRSNPQAPPVQGVLGIPPVPIDIGIGLGLPVRGFGGGGGLRPSPRLPTQGLGR